MKTFLVSTLLAAHSLIGHRAHASFSTSDAGESLIRVEIGTLSSSVSILIEVRQ
jgi:hypothetical protein